MDITNTTAANGGDAMSQPILQPAYPVELKTVLERARQGDASALPELKRAFDEHPEFITLFGDLARHVEEALLRLIAGDNLLGREAIAHQIAGLRTKLQAQVSNELEQLLADRIALTWLEAHVAGLRLTDLMLRGSTYAPAIKAAERWLAGADRRHVLAIKALATVHKLLHRSPSPVQIATAGSALRKPPVVPEAIAERRRRPLAVAEN
jgi:hypothetical protein